MRSLLVTQHFAYFTLGHTLCLCYFLFFFCGKSGLFSCLCLVLWDRSKKNDNFRLITHCVHYTLAACSVRIDVFQLRLPVHERSRRYSSCYHLFLCADFLHSATPLCVAGIHRTHPIDAFIMTEWCFCTMFAANVHSRQRILMGHR